MSEMGGVRGGGERGGGTFGGDDVDDGTPHQFFSEIFLSQTFENSGSVMVRLHFLNLALPIFYFAPPPPQCHCIIINSPILVGGFSPPRFMDQQIIAILC
jgi:hypothetical protein